MMDIEPAVKAEYSKHVKAVLHVFIFKGEEDLYLICAQFGWKLSSNEKQEEVIRFSSGFRTEVDNLNERKRGVKMINRAWKF